MEANWKRAHEELLSIARQKSRLDHEEAKWLRVAHRGQGHIRLGYGSFNEYVATTCGYSYRQSNERIRVALALGALPQIEHALEAGEV